MIKHLKLIIITTCISLSLIMCTNIGKEINFNIDLYQPDQKNYTNKDITKDFYILNFWFPSCAPCAKELPHFEKLYKEYQDNVEIIGIQMIGIDDIDEGIKFSKKLNLSFKLGYNADNSTIRKYNINSFPTTLFVSKNNDEIIIWDGYIKYEDLVKNTIKLIEDSEYND